MKDMTIKDLKSIIEGLSDSMRIVIPVIDEEDANRIYGFRKIRTAGILSCEAETPEERKVFCLNAASDCFDIADQVHYSGRDVDVVEILYGNIEENSNI